MRPTVTKVTLNSAEQSFAPGADVTLIVGPNNVGKSVILEGIKAEISTLPSKQPGAAFGPVASVSVEMPSPGDFLKTVRERSRYYEAGTRQNGHVYHANTYLYSGAEFSETQLQNASRQDSRFGTVSLLFLKHLSAEGRGSVLSSSDAPDLTEPLENLSAVQALFGDRGLEETLSGYMKRAFGVPLLVNRHAGRRMGIHVGYVAMDEPRMGEPGEYLDEVLKLPKLEHQGEGIRAFMGTILTLVTDPGDIILMDEPETFLHPPQARLLGQVIAEISSSGGPQVIVVTHSNDFVRGVIDASRDMAEVSVVRITRPEDALNHAAQVPPESIRSLYRDPLMRYSRVLDGIFYKGVVLCEGDSDCTYYSATLDAIESADELASSDMLFTHCSGKGRLVRAYGALKAAAVPTAVIADIDILENRNEFQPLFEAMGGRFADIEDHYNAIISHVRDGGDLVTRDEVRKDVTEIIDGSNAEALSNGEVDGIIRTVRAPSGWKAIKRKGRFALEGGPVGAFDQVFDAARRIGFFILPVGELESFHPEAGRSKQAWLRAVLEGQLFAKESGAWSLIREVRRFVSDSQ
ncbi:ATP-dependent nuclease [Myceligenerans cantabricum]